MLYQTSGRQISKITKAEMFLTLSPALLKTNAS